MTIGVGVIGCGRAAVDLHLPALARVTGARVVAVADVDPARLAAVAGVTAEQRETDYSALLDSSEIAAVLVAVPPSMHATVVRESVAAGKHVLVEKPLAASPKEARELVELPKGSDVQTAVGHNLRCHRLVRKAKSLLEEGVVGEPVAVRSVWSTDLGLRSELPSWRRSRASVGGVIHEMAIHHFDLWRYLLDAKLQEVVCLSRPGESEDDSVAISCRFEGGLVGSMLVSQQSAVQCLLEVWGREGRLQIDCYRFDGLSIDPVGAVPGGLGSRLRDAVRTARQLPTGIRVARRGGDYVDSYRVEWARFLDSVATGAPPSCSLEDGLYAVEAAHAAVRSAETGEVVTLVSREVANR